MTLRGMSSQPATKEELEKDQAATPPTQDKESCPVASETQAVASGKKARRKTKRGPRLPEHLPVVEDVLEPEVVKSEPLL
jgi:hypothetical protein